MALSHLARRPCDVQMRRCLNSVQAAAATSGFGGGEYSRGYGAVAVGTGVGAFLPAIRGGAGRLRCLWGRAHYGGGVW